MQKRYPVFILSLISAACFSTSFAAEPVNLDHQSPSFLNSFSAAGSSMKQLSSHVDFNQAQHVRMKQTYLGYPVWGADVIVHQGKTMNGRIYQKLNKDLGSVPNYVVNADYQKKAQQEAISLYQKKSGNKNEVRDLKNNLMIYVDKNNKAHWAYFISFFVKNAKAMPAKPTFILDATNFTVYQQWDNIQPLEDVSGGGLGGNEKMGQLTYDGISQDLPGLTMERDSDAKICYLQNADVTVKDVRNGDAVSQFACDGKDSTHNEYWDNNFDAVNGGYSPGNDALFAGKVIKNMYRDWYNTPVLVDGDGKPMMLNMRVHEYMDNAYWDGYQMTFGDGIYMFYPLVSLGVGAHEISHGFTQQHSGLVYDSQSGGLNEAFSDMAAQAAEYYAYGHNSWQIGPEIFKQDGKALRYMDQPSKDCDGGKPGDWCSIDNVSQYNEGLDVHFSSGIFNRIFYLMGSSAGWNTRKAFDVMVKANMDYWTPNTTFAEAACGVIKATGDYHYDMTAVNDAMKAVGIDTSQC